MKRIRAGVCTSCGYGFIASSMAQRKCNPHCGRHSTPAERQKKCEVCGKVFISIRKTSKVCSNECRKASRRKPKTIRIFDVAKCDNCGEEYHKKKSTHRFCSDDCRRNHQYYKPKRQRCLSCGDVFVAPGQILRCPECKAKVRRKKDEGHDSIVQRGYTTKEKSMIDEFYRKGAQL